jgi:hypothetical protein
MHHLYCRDWEGKWTYLVLEWRRRWWCCVLCFTVSSASVQFASISPSSSLLMLSHYFSTLSVFFHALLRCLPHVFLCLLSLVPPLCSVLPLAFIARGRRRYFGNSRVHHGGEEHQSRDAPPDWKRLPYHCQRLLPLMPQLLCLRRQWILLQWNGAVWISSEYIYFSFFFFGTQKWVTITLTNSYYFFYFSISILIFIRLHWGIIIRHTFYYLNLFSFFFFLKAFKIDPN